MEGWRKLLLLIILLLLLLLVVTREGKVRRPLCGVACQLGKGKGGNQLGAPTTDLNNLITQRPPSTALPRYPLPSHVIILLDINYFPPLFSRQLAAIGPLSPLPKPPSLTTGNFIASFTNGSPFERVQD